jgi:hypothetical protein
MFEAARTNTTPETLPAEPQDFRSQYLIDWALALEHAMRIKAEGGIVGSPEERMQNELLGELLARLEQPVGSLNSKVN